MLTREEHSQTFKIGSSVSINSNRSSFQMIRDGEILGFFITVERALHSPLFFDYVKCHYSEHTTKHSKSNSSFYLSTLSITHR